MLRNQWEPWDFFFQMTHTGVIDVAPDRQTATARWEMREIARTPTARGRTTPSHRGGRGARIAGIR
jgi:hypothetical protein